MAIYRREGSSIWYYDIIINGRRVRRSTGTSNERQAQELYDRLKVEAWNQERLGIKPRRMWRDVVVRYLKEAEADSKASLERDREAFRWLDTYLRDKYLDEIDKDMIAHIITEKRKSYVRVYQSGQQRVCKPGSDTVNRFLTTFRAALRKAQDEWEWIDRVPKIKAVKGTVSRIRWITQDEADQLIAELPWHLAAMARFSLETGLRRANVTHLEWSQVDLARKTAWILGNDTKNGKSLAVPLSDRAMQVLKEQQAVQQESPCKWVFAKAGRPVHQTGTRAWREALDRAGIENFRWHDLRHTWASWHVQNGTPLHVLQELGGWSSLKMVQRYAHLSSAHLRACVERPRLHLVVANQRTGTGG
jgi:integrase